MVSPKTYVRTFLALMVLLAVTVAANYVNLGPFSVATALAIAVVKAALIGLFFMEIRYSKPLTWLFAAAAFLWLLIMIGLTMNDYNTRAWSHQAWKDQGPRSPEMRFHSPDK